MDISMRAGGKRRFWQLSGRLTESVPLRRRRSRLLPRRISLLSPQCTLCAQCTQNSIITATNLALPLHAGGTVLVRVARVCRFCDPGIDYKMFQNHRRYAFPARSLDILLVKQPKQMKIDSDMTALRHVRLWSSRRAREAVAYGSEFVGQAVAFHKQQSLLRVKC